MLVFYALLSGICLVDKSRVERNTKHMAQSKAELQREIRLLRKRVKEMEELLQQTAIKVEHLQGAYDASVADHGARKDLRNFELPRIIERRL